MRSRGVVAKQLDGRYRSGERERVKTGACVKSPPVRRLWQERRNFGSSGNLRNSLKRIHAHAREGSPRSSKPVRRGSPTLGRFEPLRFSLFAGKSPAGAGLFCFHVKRRRGYFCPKLLPEQAILEQLGIIKWSPSRAS
jgi:hypothetical protein